MTESDRLWLAALHDVANRAAHQLKGALNGVSVNLEVVRSRSAKGAEAAAIEKFAAAAASQLELVSEQSEALLYLTRNQNKPSVDVALVLRHLAALLVPAAQADQVGLSVAGHDRAAVTRAPERAVRLALATGLLALIKEGGGACRLEAGNAGSDAVVRFSHESAAVGIDQAVAAAIAEHEIRIGKTGSDLTLSFPAAKA